jgi:3-hydroxyacyl-CoA dehydrogenase
VKESVEKMESDGMAVPESVKAMLAAGNDSFYKLKTANPITMIWPPTATRRQDQRQHHLSGRPQGRQQNRQNMQVASLVDIGDDVFCLEFHTKMNAINGEIVDFMAEGLDYVDANGAGW